MIDDQPEVSNEGKVNKNVMLEALRMFQKYAKAHREFFKADRAQFLLIA